MNHFRTNSMILLIIGLLSGTGLLATGANAGVTASISGPGAGDGDTIICGQPVTFKVAMLNNTGDYVTGIDHGFEISSPDGAGWSGLTGAWAPEIAQYLDGGQAVFPVDVDGVSPDTIGFSAFSLMEPGVPNGYDDVILRTELTVDTADAGKTVCIDSCWYPPSGTWKWSTPGGDFYPDWGGPYCYPTKGPNTYLYVNSSYSGSPCCWQFDLSQSIWGSTTIPLTKVVLEVLTPNVTVSSATGPTGAPQGPDIDNAANPVTITYYMPLPDGLAGGPKIVYACFDGVTGSGFDVRPTGYSAADDPHTTYPGDKGKSFPIPLGYNGECACVHWPWGMVLWLPFDEEETDKPDAKNLRGKDGHHYEGTTQATIGLGPSCISWGKVNNALFFDGNNDHVDVPHYHGIDVWYNDFTIDAWIQREGLDHVRVIAEKREQSSYLHGYSFYMYDGRLGLQLAAGSAGYTNWNLDPVYAIPVSGDWHHVAVTVDRDDPAGIVFYIDGQPMPQTFDPSGYAASSLNNNSVFRVGDKTVPITGGSPYVGGIDEVEFFRRPLTATEIQGIYQAGEHGKCRKRFSLPWSLQPAPSLGSMSGTALLTNSDVGPKTYHYSFAALPYGDVPGPTNFTPGSGTVTLAPGTCVDIPFDVEIPAGMQPGERAYYEMIVEDSATGYVVSEVSRLVPTDSDLWVIFDVGFAEGLMDSLIDLGHITLTNGTDTAETVNYRARAELVGAIAKDHPCVSLNGLEPGVPLEGQQVIPAGQSVNIPLDGKFVDYSLLDHVCVTVEILIDGEWPQKASMFFINVMEPASCCQNRGNADGVIGVGGPIDVADLSYLVDYLFRGGAEPPCFEEGNVDGLTGPGGGIDVADLSYLVDYLFRGGPEPPPCN